MKIGYFGSPQISARLLQTILEDGKHEVVFVCSNPDSPRKRSGKPVPTEVSELALERGIPLLRPESLKEPEILETFQGFGADLFFIFAYGKLIPRAIIDVPPKKTVNLHASFLPELRGASPIQAAVIRGFKETGWSLQFIVPRLDAGDLIASSEPVPIELDDTAGSLTEKLVELAIPFVREIINNFEKYSTRPVPQDHDLATFCGKITPDMAMIDWTQPALTIHNQVRGMNPSPIATTSLKGKRVKILKTAPFSMDGEENQLQGNNPGSLLVWSQGKRKRLVVPTGDGYLEILELQPENKKAVPAESFLNGFRSDGNDAFDPIPTPDP